MTAQKVAMLLDDVCVKALRQQFDGVKKACCPAKGQAPIDPNELMEHWKSTVPGFEDVLQQHVSNKEGLEYPARWNLNKLVDQDKNEIVRLVRDVIATEDESPEPGPKMYQLFLTICMLCHGSKHKQLPSSARTDPHGLWAAFCEYYPMSKDVIMEQFPRKRKKPSDDPTADIRARLHDIESKLDAILRSMSTE